MTIIDDLIDSGLSDEDIIGLLMEKKLRMRKKEKLKETKVKTLVLEDTQPVPEQTLSNMAEENVNVETNETTNTGNDTSIETLKAAISEMADNVLYRVGQMCVGTKLDTKSAVQIICQHLDAKQVQDLENFSSRIDVLIAG